MPKGRRMFDQISDDDNNLWIYVIKIHISTLITHTQTHSQESECEWSVSSVFEILNAPLGYHIKYIILAHQRDGTHLMMVCPTIVLPTYSIFNCKDLANADSVGTMISYALGVGFVVRNRLSIGTG